MSPTARTKQFFEKLGCDVAILERWNKFARIRQDVWGADLLVRQGLQGLAIQATDSTSHSKRVDKSLGHPGVRNWLKMGVNFYVYSWGLKGARGERKRYQMRVTQLVLNKRDEVVVL